MPWAGATLFTDEQVPPESRSGPRLLRAQEAAQDQTQAALPQASGHIPASLLSAYKKPVS